MTTDRVRIALIMTPDRRYDVRGWGGPEGPEEDHVLLEALTDGALGNEPGAVVRWIEADVPVPEPPASPRVIEGTVVEEERHA